MRKICTLVTLTSIVLGAFLGIIGVAWWLTALVALVGMIAFLVNAGVRGNFRTVTRPMTLQREYRAGWLLVGGAVAGAAAPANAIVIGLSVALGASLIFIEPKLAPKWGALTPSVRNLPGAQTFGWVRSAVTVFLLLGLGGSFALFLVPAAGSPVAWLSLAVNALAAVLAASVSLYATRMRPLVSNRKWEAVEEYGPVFALYFSAPAGSAYQVKMWAPFLDRTGLPWVIILRERRYLNQFAEITDAPVVVASRMSSLDRALVPSIRAVFYVNNSFKNSHCVRFADRTHVQLLHGDSDKVASFSPVTAMYDRVFVAGRAGQDRYARHGVAIPDEKFRIVGRPQVEGIERDSDGSKPPGEERKPTVLYAPTWQGFQKDANFSSLPRAEVIVRALIGAGCRVIFRAHPSSMRSSGSAAVIARVVDILADDARQGTDHLFGERAQDEIDLVECMNLSDALVTDISSVPGDYLFSEKPFITAKTFDDMSETEFVTAYPLAGASYIWDWTRVDQLPSVIRQMLDEDPLREKRTSMRQYYLGDFASEGYADHFIEAVRTVVNENYIVTS